MAVLAVGVFALGWFYHQVSPQIRVGYGTVLLWSAVYGCTAFQVEMMRGVWRRNTKDAKIRE